MFLELLGEACSQATTWGIGAVTGSALWWQCFQSSPTLLPAAVQKGFDVFNALDLMENKTFLEKLKFGIGDGNLQYYLYNWKCPSMGAEKVRARRAGSSDYSGRRQVMVMGPVSVTWLRCWEGSKGTNPRAAPTRVGFSVSFPSSSPGLWEPPALPSD